MTRVGERVLTPDYASPEQIRGESITTATDVYSLGVVLYRLLTGRAPYSFPSGRSSEIEKIVCEREPEPPRLSEDLDTILGKALAKEPARRYATVVELSEDLRRFSRTSPSRPGPTRWCTGPRSSCAATARASPPPPPRPWRSPRASPSRSRSAATARREARKAEQINAFLQEILGAASPWRDGSKVTVKEVLDRASGRIATELSSEPEVEAGVRRTIGETYSGLGLYDEAESHLTKALERSRSEYGGASDEAAATLNALAALRTNRGDAAAAEAPAREALAIRQRAPRRARRTHRRRLEPTGQRAAGERRPRGRGDGATQSRRHLPRARDTERGDGGGLERSGRDGRDPRRREGRGGSPPRGALRRAESSIRERIPTSRRRSPRSPPTSGTRAATPRMRRLSTSSRWRCAASSSAATIPTSRGRSTTTPTC